MGKEGIHFILTGGTMDSHYDGTKDTVVPNKESVIPNYINGLKLYSKVKFTQICMKDSRDITKFDQKKILELIEKSSENKFIITHGTYTMSDTARYIKANLKRKDIRIIFTGSFIPMTGFMNSDGLFNLGFLLLRNSENGCWHYYLYERKNVFSR